MLDFPHKPKRSGVMSNPERILWVRIGGFRRHLRHRSNGLELEEQLLLTGFMIKPAPAMPLAVDLHKKLHRPWYQSMS